jgi:hypothetical protein
MSVVRAPNRADSRSVYRTDSVPMTTATGRKARPICSGLYPTELIGYARWLRPRYRTGLVSNSFVGAREREQAAYGFEDLVDEIIYSHWCGMSIGYRVDFPDFVPRDTELIFNF